MRVLAIDTAGPVAGVALWIDGQVSERRERTTRGTERRLMPWAVELASEAGMALSSLDGLAVGAGPGAFTGLRVGLASALGLALALDRPVVACSTLDSRAARGHAGPLLCALDARKGRLYAALYVDGVCVVPGADVPPEVAVAWARGPFAATGEGALVAADAIRAAGGRTLDDPEDPATRALARMGAESLARGEGCSALDVRPTYLREADAVPPRPR